MILFDKLFTDQADVPSILELCEQKYPSIWGDFGDMAKARVEQNLREAVGEQMDTEVIIDPFLAEASAQLRKTAAQYSGRTLTVYDYTLTSSRGFYTRKNPKATATPCDYFKKEFEEFENKNTNDIIVRFLLVPDNSVKGHFDRNGTGRVPKRVRISRRFLARLYVEWRNNGYGDSHLPLTRLCEVLGGIGTNRAILCALVQGLTIKVDRHKHDEHPVTGQIPLCSLSGDQISAPYVSSELVEPVYEKVRSDDEAARLLFQAKTHVGKFVINPTTAGSFLHEIRSASIDNENEVFIELDPNTAGSQNTVLFHPKNKFHRLPRYIRRNFWVRAKPGSKAENDIKVFKGRDAHKGACQIRQIQLNPATNKIELLLRTRRFGDVWIPLSDDLFTPKSVKGSWPATLRPDHPEEQWQRYLGRRQHPPKPDKKPATKKAAHPFGEPDEVFARTSAQAREALRPRIPRGVTFATPPMMDPEMTRANEMMERAIAQMLATPAGEARRPLTAEDIERAREVLREAPRVHDEIIVERPRG